MDIGIRFFSPIASVHWFLMDLEKASYLLIILACYENVASENEAYVSKWNIGTKIAKRNKHARKEHDIGQ